MNAPIVVGGLGGSGTRLVVQMLQQIGVFMGAFRNASEDAMPFVPVYDGHINVYLAGRVHYPTLMDALMMALGLHFGGESDDLVAPWGWKNPRSIYLLPLLDELFDGLRFIHVVRDGVAMAASENQAQLNKHGRCVIPERFQGMVQGERALLLWSIVNNAAADYGKQMGSRYILLRYEDICEEPANATAALASSLGIAFEIDKPDRSGVIVHSSRVRNGNLNVNMETEAAQVATATLRRFGYPC